MNKLDPKERFLEGLTILVENFENEVCVEIKSINFERTGKASLKTGTKESIKIKLGTMISYQKGWSR